MINWGRSLKHGTSKISTYRFEGLCVKRACYDTFACYLTNREPDRMNYRVCGVERHNGMRGVAGATIHEADL